MPNEIGAAEDVAGHRYCGAGEELPLRRMFTVDLIPGVIPCPTPVLVPAAMPWLDPRVRSVPRSHCNRLFLLPLGCMVAADLGLAIAKSQRFAAVLKARGRGGSQLLASIGGRLNNVWRISPRDS